MQIDSTKLQYQQKKIRKFQSKGVILRTKRQFFSTKHPQT